MAPGEPAGEGRERVREIVERLRGARGEYWQVQRCPSCDDHGGHGREWSVWSGGAQGVRVAHGLHQHEALTIAKHVNTLRESMDDAAAALAQRPRAGAPGGEAGDLAKFVHDGLEEVWKGDLDINAFLAAIDKRCVDLLAAPAPVAPPPSVVDEDDLAENADYLPRRSGGSLMAYNCTCNPTGPVHPYGIVGCLAYAVAPPAVEAAGGQPARGGAGPTDEELAGAHVMHCDCDIQGVGGAPRTTTDRACIELRARLAPGATHGS